MKTFGLAVFAAVLLLSSPGRGLAAQGTEIVWYGQSAFKVTTPGGGVLLIDPWIKNPLNPGADAFLESPGRVDYILVTHGHRDHVGESAQLAVKTGARLVANADLTRAMVQYCGFPEKNTDRSLSGSFGGEMRLLDGEVVVRFVPAVHGSTVEAGQDSPLAGKAVAAGQASGLVIAIKNGPTLYHTGDTDVFSDMALIGQDRAVDVMLACIGGHFTMGPAGAAKAARLVKPAVVIGMHYGGSPLLSGAPDQLRQALAALPGKGPKPKVVELAVGKPWFWPEKR